MTIHFSCVECGAALKVKDELAGSTGHCPKCKTEFKVPAASTVASKSSKAGEDFDPVAFLTEEPAESHVRKATIPADLNEQAAEQPGGTKGSKPPKGDPTGNSPNAASDIWNQAMAAREMRNALKASVKEAKVKRSESHEAQFNWGDILREYAPKVIIGVVSLVVITGGLYWFFDNMMGGKLRLPSLGYVSGQVTLDGDPLSGATVYFAPMDDPAKENNERKRTSLGTTDATGHYKMYYMEKVEGVAVGKCRVWVELIGPQGRDLVPPEFTQAMMTTKDVAAGKQTIDFAMKGRVPAPVKK